MATRSDKFLSQTYMAKRVQQILDLSEEKLLNVLQGKIKEIPERMIVMVALEIYKRRVPMKVEGEHQGSQLTIVKIVKNHLPDNHGEVVDLPAADTFEKIELKADEIINERVQKLNEQIKKNVEKLNRPGMKDEE